MRVLVTGAGGFVGGRLVPALRAAGHEVVALVRDADGYDAPEGVRVLEGDLLASDEIRMVSGPGETPAQPLGSLLAALDVDAAYYLVHSMAAGEDFAERDRRAARAFADAASAAEIERVVYLGGLGGDDGDLSEHLRSRREVERVLADGDYALTTLRAGIVIGARSAGFEIVRQLADRLPVMVTPRWVRTECQPIFVDDAVAYLVGVLDAPATAGGTYEIGGPEVLTYEDLLRRTRAALGGRLYVVPVPVLSPRLSSRWVRLVTDVPRAVVDPLVDGLRTPVVADDGPIRAHVPVNLTPLDDALRVTLDRREASEAAETPAEADEPGGGDPGGPGGDAGDSTDGRTADDDAADPGADAGVSA